MQYQMYIKTQVPCCLKRVILSEDYIFKLIKIKEIVPFLPLREIKKSNTISSLVRTRPRNFLRLKLFTMQNAGTNK